MKLLSSLVSSVLLTASTTTLAPPSTRAIWYIDGNNLMGHKGTPRDRQTIADKLKPVESATSALRVMLVWDGYPGQESTSILPEVIDDDDDDEMGTAQSIFQVVSLAKGITTDDWIMGQLKELKESSHSSKVHVVTADRALRRKVLESKPVVKGVVNPVVFWRRYRPRLTGLKSDYANVPKSPIDE